MTYREEEERDKLMEAKDTKEDKHMEAKDTKENKHMEARDTREEKEDDTIEEVGPSGIRTGTLRHRYTAEEVPTVTFPRTS